MADTNEEVLQDLAQDNYGLDLNGALRVATGLALDANGICRALWGKEFNAAGPEMAQVLGNRALLLTGASGAYASTPDAADLDIVGDLDLRVEYVNTGGSGNQSLLSKWNTTGNQRSYQIRRSAFGTLDMTVSTDGIVEPGNATVPASVPGAFRKTIDVDNGASQRVFTTYVATSLDGPWTQIAQDTVAGAIALFISTSVLAVGATNAGTADRFVGRITRAQVRAGIDGTIVANPDFRALAPGTTSFADSTGKTWTVHGGAVV